MNSPTPYDRQRLRAFVRVFYDFQDLRLRTAGRVTSANEDKKDGTGKKKAPLAAMTPDDAALIAEWASKIEELEAEALSVIRQELRRDPVYTGFLADVPGVGPTMAAVLLGGGFDIIAETTPSKMWAYCGLAPGQHPVKGQKLGYNPLMKTKIVGVLADCIMKACVRAAEQAFCPTCEKWLDVEGVIKGVKRKGEKRDPDTCSSCSAVVEYRPSVDGPPPDDSGDWRLVNLPWMVDDKGAPAPRWAKSYTRAYFDYRHRKQCQIVSPCMLCSGTGKVRGEEPKPTEDESLPDSGAVAAPAAKVTACWNCGGGTKPASWGKGDAHRHRAALRYMVKSLLLDFWKFWRTSEGLSVREPYCVEKLGMPPHGGSK
ncbi:MAG: hypothetical protein Q8S13_05340 [Dehalococcoidia bacterium]|nr:hypothetical protein [Dehalococcoidia bacterium]